MYNSFEVSLTLNFKLLCRTVLCEHNFCCQSFGSSECSQINPGQTFCISTLWFGQNFCHSAHYDRIILEKCWPWVLMKILFREIGASSLEKKGYNIKNLIFYHYYYHQNKNQIKFSVLHVFLISNLLWSFTQIAQLHSNTWSLALFWVTFSMVG